jgi:Zn-dependent M28 family amino/carboxypeptidase
MNPKIIIATAVVVAGGIIAGFLYWKQSGADAHGKAAYAHTAAILAIGPRTPGSDGLKKSQQYISEQLAQSGWKTITQTIQRNTSTGKRTFINLIARYEPGDIQTLDDLSKLPTKGILCAHLDSKEIPDIPEFLGADDATSACALMIELATTLAKENPQMAKQLELVFFDGEEAFGEHMTIDPQEGLYGSRAYANTLYNRKPKPEFGILLDMIGHKNLKIAVPGDTPPHLYDSLIRAAEKHGEEKRYSKLTDGVLDDHYYLNKAGVPTIDIIGADFFNSHWWHQKGDTIDLISAKSLTISYHVTLTMLRELLGK